ncbi:unnamed protein product [Clonostachys byssicola]|uniref:DUF1993 domain-containing protein n=1 Tax=Clonostachys byssicola TaxID=160290 RepID=A0A9N9Y854_9HYPO|nr:unnamed protein product [Clonostachys byssicola]
MVYSLYDASIGQAKNVLDAFLSILAKVEASPVAGTIATARIHENMLPFSFQVHFTSVLAHKLSARLQGQPPRDLAYKDLDTVEQMRARILEVKAEVDAVGRDVINSRETEIVSLGLGPGIPEAQVEGWQYVHGYAVPNLFFHLTTAYDIARKEGVEIGKNDYLGPFLDKYTGK